MYHQNRLLLEQICSSESSASNASQTTAADLAQSILPSLPRSSSSVEMTNPPPTKADIQKVESKLKNGRKRKIDCLNVANKEEKTSAEDIPPMTTSLTAAVVLPKRDKYIIPFGETNLILNHVIGEGSFGRVFSATSELESASSSSANFAVKVNSNFSKDSMKTFLNEARLLNDLKRFGGKEWNVTDFLGMTIQDKKIHLIFPRYVSDLYTEMIGTAPRLTKTASIADQLFSALSFLSHFKPPVIHADIKPENIFVESIEPLKIRLGDFGAFRLGPKQNTSGEYIVTRYYRAPEILLELPFDCSLDTWSVSCVIYEYHTKKVLFKGANELQLLKKIQRLLGPVSIDFLQSKTVDNKPLKYQEFLSQQKQLQPLLMKHLDKMIGFSHTDYADFASEAHVKDCVFFLKDMLKLMLTWDSSSRLSPPVAKLHPFLISLFDKKDLHFLAKQMYGDDCMRSFAISS